MGPRHRTAALPQPLASIPYIVNPTPQTLYTSAPADLALHPKPCIPLPLPT